MGEDADPDDVVMGCVELEKKQAARVKPIFDPTARRPKVHLVEVLVAEQVEPAPIGDRYVKAEGHAGRDSERAI